MCLQKAGKSQPLWVHKSRCLATTSRAGVDRMIRNAVMKTVNLWASKKVLCLHLTIKTSPCAITRLSSCPLWNFLIFFFNPSEAGRSFCCPWGISDASKITASQEAVYTLNMLHFKIWVLPSQTLFFFNFSFYVFSTKMLLITSQIEFKNNKRSPERKLPFFQPNCKKSQIE